MEDAAASGVDDRIHAPAAELMDRNQRLERLTAEIVEGPHVDSVVRSSSTNCPSREAKPAQRHLGYSGSLN